jgi:DNA (cytosine-5)-methyltransferase 1
MSAYYNEHDDYLGAWLKALIKQGMIPDGEVDTRSIVVVSPEDLRGFTQCHFFAGIAGWAYACRLAEWPDDRPIWTGSCPCQPFSVAGNKVGRTDERHLWPIWFKLIEAIKPPVVMGEQVAPAIGKGWLDETFSDLEGLGYSCGAAIVPAVAVGAIHKRDRLWFVAHPQRDEQQGGEQCSGPVGRVGRQEEPFPWDTPWETAFTHFRDVDDGLPRRMGATDAARNAVVPQIAAEIIKSYMEAYDG